MERKPEQDLFDAIHAGDEAAFEKLYDLYHERVRLTAWRISHRADWIDDLLNEAWCRAFDQRRTYNPQRPFLVWVAGILRNVYREQCRQSPLTHPSAGGGREIQATGVDWDPERLAHEAEALAGLNECLKRLNAEDARIVRLRYFDGMSLRYVAKEVNLSESTLRESRLPSILDSLRRCLAEKKIEIPEVFSAQEGYETQ